MNSNIIFIFALLFLITVDCSLLSKRGNGNEQTHSQDDNNNSNNNWNKGKKPTDDSGNTISNPKPIIPIVRCRTTGRFLGKAIGFYRVFYDNQNTVTVRVWNDRDSDFNGTGAYWGFSPRRFKPGQNEVVPPLSFFDDATVTWTINGPDGKSRSILLSKKTVGNAQQAQLHQLPLKALNLQLLLLLNLQLLLLPHPQLLLLPLLILQLLPNLQPHPPTQLPQLQI